MHRVSSLPRITPEAQGLSAAALDAFVGALDASEQEIQTLMLVRHGQVVLEEAWAPYRIEDPHLLFSISKSFTSMGIGLLVEDGKLSIDDKVVSFFSADELPAEVSDNLAAMEIRHLLTMSTGHTQDTIEALGRDERMIRTFLGLEVGHAPGAPFVYNTGATYMLSAILQKVTGETLLDYLRPRLFEPLGIGEATWPTSKEGVTLGGWGLSISTESLARFSQFLLQRGEWDGKQLVPAAWIDEATKKQVDNSVEVNPDWRQGYGYQFWRARNNAYRGDGAFGQYCLVFPDHDTTLVITSASPNMQAVMDIIWEHLLPALQGEAGDGTARPPRLELLPPAGPTLAATGGGTSSTPTRWGSPLCSSTLTAPAPSPSCPARWLTRPRCPRAGRRSWSSPPAHGGRISTSCRTRHNGWSPARTAMATPSSRSSATSRPRTSSRCAAGSMATPCRSTCASTSRSGHRS